MADQDPQRDKLFDHEYDGIQEYDNPMPSWWVWLFVGSIVFSIVYAAWFHFVGANLRHERSIHGALEREVAAYGELVIATYGELEPDEATILTYMNDQGAMAAMAGLFKGKCAQCHVADGSGNVGPNLTDGHWINVKDVTDIAKVITIGGRTGKGMTAWGDKLTTTQIVLLSSYVAQMQRNPIAPPAGKAPQGDPLPPWPDAPAEEPPADPGEA